jgi:hypothetical protein
MSRSAKHEVPRCTTSPAPAFFYALIGLIHDLIAPCFKSIVWLYCFVNLYLTNNQKLFTFSLRLRSV